MAVLLLCLFVLLGVLERVLLAFGVGAAGDGVAAGAADHVPAAVDRGQPAHGGRAEGAEIGHRAGGPCGRIVLREPAAAPAAPEKEHVV
jgi:hypothetical protein